MEIAVLVSWTLTLLGLGGVLAWIVFVDSKKRWPWATAWERYVAVVTFQRNGPTRRG